MDIPFYRNPKEICKTLKTGDNLDPPKNNIKTQSSHNNFDYLSDIVFTTGVIFFIHLGVKTVFNFGSISLKLLTDNFYGRVKKNNARVSGEIPIEYKKKGKTCDASLRS